MSRLPINLIIFCIKFCSIFADVGDDFEIDRYGDTDYAGEPEGSSETETKVKERPTILTEDMDTIASDPAKMECYCQGSIDMINKVSLFSPNFLGRNLKFPSQEPFIRFARAMQNKLREISKELCSGRGKDTLEEFIKFCLEMNDAFLLTMIEPFMRYESIRKKMYLFYNEIFTSKALILKCTYDVEW
ncbi:uncharacterized protein LOC127010838 isoform X1 [Drosophila biarmipes]|uniref:uncharacterized protein LOC127010838 isoform X1 n=1 Tax=Drosophila biarmipes TaxID=125945 RepID=UPI0021CCF1DA|nr:uncharacterized protein LOC127010838 isoform X1 [Drosophila biarmipes]